MAVPVDRGNGLVCRVLRSLSRKFELKGVLEDIFRPC